MKYFTLSAILLAGLGCTNVQPIGPLAKHSHKKPSTPEDPDIPPPPSSMATAQKLVPPAMLIVPGEVDSDSAAAAAQKLTNEFEYDYKTLPPPSRTAEISRYKGGVKVN